MSVSKKWRYFLPFPKAAYNPVLTSIKHFIFTCAYLGVCGSRTLGPFLPPPLSFISISALDVFDSASTRVQTHTAAILWINPPALTPPHHKSHPAERLTESDSAPTTLLPTSYFWVAPSLAWTCIPARSHVSTSQLMAPLPQLTRMQPLPGDSQSLVRSRLDYPMGIHSEIPGRNSAVQSVCSQRRNFWHQTGSIPITFPEGYNQVSRRHC